MPLFLLLAETTWTWQFAAKQLESWVHMVSVEEVLIERARSAFLVHWFGKHLPFKGLNLKVHIANLQELSDRYMAAAKSAKGEVTGLNLTEPLAGIAGQVAGAIASPVGIILYFAATIRKAKKWMQVLMGVLLTLMLTPFFWSATIAGVVLGLGVPLGFLAGIFLGGTKEENTGAAIELLGALAKLLNAARVLLEIIMGPVDQIKNPVLRTIVTLFRSFAALVPQVLGFVAILVTRIGPLLLPAIRGFQALLPWIQPVVRTLQFILKDMFKRLLDPVDPILRTLHIVITQVQKVTDIFLNAFINFFNQAIPEFKDIYQKLKGQSADDTKKIKGGGFLGFFDMIAGWLKDAIHNHPLMRLFDALNLIKAATAGVKMGKVVITGHFAWMDFPKTLKDPDASSEPSTFPDLPDLSIAAPGDALFFYDIKARLLGRTPDPFESIVSKGKALKLDAAPIGAIPLSAEAERQLYAFRNPPSAFGPERQQVLDFVGGKPEDMLRGQQQLRDLLSVVVGRILPPQLRSYMDDLVMGLKKLDDAVLGTKRKKLEEPNYPVRHIPDNGELWPIVRRLTVRSPGGNKFQIQDFEDRVRKAMLAQRYLAPDPA